MPSNPPAGVPPITLDPRSWTERLQSSVADRGRPYAHVPDLSVPPLERARQLATSLLSERGEASGAAVARELLRSLNDLELEDRAAFQHFLAEGLRPIPAPCAARQRPTWPSRRPSAPCNSGAAEPPRQELLRRMNMAPGGNRRLGRDAA